MTNKPFLTPREVAAQINHSRGFVMSLIAAGELAASDERRPGSKRPMYRITPEAIASWQLSRRIQPASELDRRMSTMPRMVGVLRKMSERRAARRAKRESPN